MSFKRKIGMFLVFLCFMTSLIGCRPKNQQEEKKSIDEDEFLIPKLIYKGEKIEPIIKVYVLSSEKIEIMAFEDYIAYVIAGEMPNNWPEAALEAQAILARTFALEFIQDKGGSKYKGAHISTDISEAQAWDKEAINERIKRVIEHTRGRVVTHEGKLIKGWFHAHSGGKTATAKEGLAYTYEEPPYIKSVDSLEGEKGPRAYGQWEYTFTKEEVTLALKKLGFNIAGFEEIGIEKRGPSGRAVFLKFDQVLVSAPGFRLSIGSSKMRSTLIHKITVSKNKVSIKGQGYGHGVGMSQWGAYHLAKEGRDYEAIIKHYFKDVEIVRLWE